MSLKPVLSLLLPVLLVLIIFHTRSSPFDPASSWRCLDQWRGTAGQNWGSNLSEVIESMKSKLKDSVTFLPLKDLRLSETAMEGPTWFMSSVNDTLERDEPEQLVFPSEASMGRILCIKGHDQADGTKNSYALAWPEYLPPSATLLKGLTFVSSTYYNYKNLWHAACAMVPFVRWLMKNECAKPARWVFFNRGELQVEIGSWIRKLMEATFGEINIERLVAGGEEGPYCFEMAVVMRHDMGSTGKENKLRSFDLLRCKARAFCGLGESGRGKEVDERGDPIVRVTLLTRRGSRSFKNTTAVYDVFKRECKMVDGCILEMVQSEELNFCDQVRVMTYTDIVASPHGAQLTNMIFMDRNGSVMEFFPKGWLEHAGPGQYAFHWLADQSGMRHRGAWWDPVGDECPFPRDELKCFDFHKDGKVGHNETHLAQWTRRVLQLARGTNKLQGASKSPGISPETKSSVCPC